MNNHYLLLYGSPNVSNWSHTKLFRSPSSDQPVADKISSPLFMEEAKSCISCLRESTRQPVLSVWLQRYQTALAALLEEKLRAETRAAEAEKLLSEARAAASRAEEKVSGLEAELTVAKSEYTAGTTGYAREQGAATGEASHVSTARP